MQHVDALSLLSAKQNVLQRMHLDRGCGRWVCVCVCVQFGVVRALGCNYQKSISAHFWDGWGGCNFRQDFARVAEGYSVLGMVLFGVCVDEGCGGGSLIMHLLIFDNFLCVVR